MAWHPLMALTEPKPGDWWVVDKDDKPYGHIYLVKRGAQMGTGPTVSLRKGYSRTPSGYFLTLRAAAEAVHASFLRDRGPATSREYGR